MSVTHVVIVSVPGNLMSSVEEDVNESPCPRGASKAVSTVGQGCQQQLCEGKVTSWFKRRNEEMWGVQPEVLWFHGELRFPTGLQPFPALWRRYGWPTHILYSCSDSRVAPYSMLLILHSTVAWILFNYGFVEAYVAPIRKNIKIKKPQAVRICPVLFNARVETHLSEDILASLYL